MLRLITSLNTEQKNALKLQKLSVPLIYKKQLYHVLRHSKQRVLTSLLILNVQKICFLTRNIAGHAYAVRQKRKDGTLQDVDFSIKNLQTIHNYRFITAVIFDMNKRFTIFFIGILLFSIGLYNYQEQTSVNAEIFCEEENQICVSCPNAKQISSPIINEGYTYVSYSSQFKIMVSKKGNYFSRINCRQFLQLISSPNFQIQSEELNQYFQNQLIEIKNSVIDSSLMDSFYIKLFNYSDFIVFYKNQDNQKPSLKILNQANLEKLLKFQRSISWSMLFTIILKALDYKINLCTTRISAQFPWMETIILLFGIIFENEIQLFFIYQHVSEMMFLAFAVYKLLPPINEKLIVGLFFMLCIGQYLSPIGYILVFISFWKYQINTKQLLNVIIIFSIVIAFLLKFIQTNFIIYANQLWIIIMYPLILLQFQLPNEQSFHSIFHQTNDMS